jgi:hypothetical protein
MTNRKNMVSKILATFGVTALVAVGVVTPSAAATSKRVHHTRAYDARAYNAQASVALPRAVARQRTGGGYFAHGAPDDPPGSAFQTFGNDESMGLVR